MNIQALKQFLFASNQAGYAGGEAKKWLKETDHSTTIPFTKGDWKSQDNFFGGEPYGGRLVVFHKDKPVWIMVYYGWVEEGIDPNPIYEVLRGALMRMPKDYPFRGPKKFVLGKFTYQNNWQGEVERYSGQEKILLGKKVIYQASYFGGLIDQRRGI